MLFVGLGALLLSIVPVDVLRFVVAGSNLVLEIANAFVYALSHLVVVILVFIPMKVLLTLVQFFSLLPKRDQLIVKIHALYFEIHAG